MRHRFAIALGLAVALLAPAARAQSPFPPAALDRAREAREAGLRDDVAWEALRSITTEVGPRLAGSPGDARAVAWALATMKRLGFQNVHAESVMVPHWVRGEAHVEITSPWPQPLAACALGGSVGTPESGVEAEVVAARTLEELAALGEARVRGRIVFFHGRMQRTRDGAGYGARSRYADAARSRPASWARWRWSSAPWAPTPTGCRTPAACATTPRARASPRSRCRTPTPTCSNASSPPAARCGCGS